MRRFMVLLVPALACAAPGRDGLIKAWESAMSRDGSLATRADGSYRYCNEAIGYDGRVNIVSAIVRNDGVEEIGQPDMAAMGTVDFDLVHMPARARDSVAPGLMMWKAERQTFICDGRQQAWRTATAWAKAHDDRAQGGGYPYVPMRWLMDYAIPIGLVALIVASRAQRQSKTRMREASQINRVACDNVDRTALLQEEQRARMQESIELARRNAATLVAILKELRRRV